MTLPINNTKRSYPGGENSPKRSKIENPLFHQILSDQELAVTLFARFRVTDLGNFAQVSKQLQEIARRAFEMKAQAQNLPFKTPSEAIMHFENLSWESITTILSEPKSYLSAESFAVPFLGACSTLQQADPTEYPYDETLKRREIHALCLASYYQKTKIVSLFLKHIFKPLEFSYVFCHPECPDIQLPSPLHISILKGDLQTVAVHLDHGVHLWPNDQILEFRRMYSFNSVDEIIGQFECAVGGRKAVYLESQAALNFPLINYLIERGLKPQSYDLIGAAEVPSMEALELLMKHGAELDKETSTEALISLLDRIKHKKLSPSDPSTRQMIEFLIKNQADVNNFGNHFKYTPLQLAILSGCIDLVKLLLASGAKLESKEDALELARAKDFKDIEELILSQPSQ